MWQEKKGEGYIQNPRIKLLGLVQQVDNAF